MSLLDSVALAKDYVTEAIRRSFSMVDEDYADRERIVLVMDNLNTHHRHRRGHGPLNHFYKLWQ